MDKELVKAVSDTLNKVFGAGACYAMADAVSVSENAIPSGVTALDYGLLGIGGFAQGHFTEISGDPGAGKTTLILHIMASCQEMDLVPVVVDPKGAVVADVLRAQRIGIEPESCLQVPIESSDDALQGVRETFEELKKKATAIKRRIGVAFFWDDMGLTPSDAEVDPNIDQKTGKEKTKVGSKAQSIWRFCRSLAGECYRAGAPMIVVNQLTAIIHTGWAPKGAPTEISSGGGGLKFASRVRLTLKRGQLVTTGSGPNKRTVGQVVWASTEKNAFFPPHKKASLFLDYVNGYDTRLSTIYSAISAKILVKEKTKFKIAGAPRGTGSVTMQELLTNEYQKYLAERLWPWINAEYSLDDVEVEEEATPESEASEEEYAAAYVEGGDDEF